MSTSCYAAWELQYRALAWKLQATPLISVKLFRLSSEFAADTEAVGLRLRQRRLRKEAAALFGLSREIAADTQTAGLRLRWRRLRKEAVVEERGGGTVPLNPAERSLEDDLRGSAIACCAGCNARLKAGGSGAADRGEGARSLCPLRRRVEVREAVRRGVRGGLHRNPRLRLRRWPERR